MQKVWFYIAIANEADEFFSYQVKRLDEEQAQAYLDEQVSKNKLAVKAYAWPIRASEMRPSFFEKPLCAKLPF